MVDIIALSLSHGLLLLAAIRLLLRPELDVETRGEGGEAPAPKAPRGRVRRPVMKTGRRDDGGSAAGSGDD